MNTEKAIQILEALASGCHPQTGELINEESILNERDVIRALQIALNNLKASGKEYQKSSEIQMEDIDKAIKLFAAIHKNPTANRVTAFLSAGRRFRDEKLLKNPLYGKYSGSTVSKGQLIDFVERRLLDLGVSKAPVELSRIDFFEKETFNHLISRAQEKLIQRIRELGMHKTENLSKTIIQARAMNPRAYEPWLKEETELLTKAMEYTNDLKFLARVFQRGQGAIRSYGENILRESENLKQIRNKIN